MKKIPIEGYREGNCCPSCGSLKITEHRQNLFCCEFDLNKNRPIIRDFRNKITTRPSNRIMSVYATMAFNSNANCVNYECRKCGWISETFSEANGGL